VGLTGTDREPSEYAELVLKLEAAQETDAIEQALTAARDHLGMDASYITTMDSKQQAIHAILSDDQDLVTRMQGKVFPVEQTFCLRMLGGQIPNLVPDTRAEPAISHLPAAGLIHAYVGVPVKLSDGRIHGTLCCVSRETRPAMQSEELRFMEVLSGIVAARIEQARGDMAKLTSRFSSPPD
jgi:GAF domain-containing protein